MATQETEKLNNSQLAAASSILMPVPHQNDTTTIKDEDVDCQRYNLRTRKRKASPATANKPTQKRSHRINSGPSTNSIKSPLATTSHNGRPKKAPRAKILCQEPTDKDLKAQAKSLGKRIQSVMRKVEKKHSESFKLRERRRHNWQVVEECDTTVVVDQRYIVGLNVGDRCHFTGQLNKVDRKLGKTYDKLDKIQDALDNNRDAVDGFLEEHDGLLEELARVKKIIRDRVIRARDL